MTKTFAERCKMFEQCLPDSSYRDLLTALHTEMLAKLAEQPAPAAPVQQEPFGYFKAEPFGWTDCAETDEGAIALYTTPQAQPAPEIAIADAYRAGVDSGIAAEREACAKVCDSRGLKFFSESPFAVECHGLAAAIRARGKT